MYSLFGFIIAFLGARALVKLPAALKENKHGFRKWLVSGATQGFIYVVLFFFLRGLLNGDGVLEAMDTVFSFGTVAGSLLGFVTGTSSSLKRQYKKENSGKKEKKQDDTMSRKVEEEIREADPNSALEQIRRLRIEIQEEIKRKEQEARRMMNDTYLKEDAKAQILGRYRDCVQLLQELYTEASNVLAYLETNGSNFHFDLDDLYVSEDKQNDLQSQLDRLRAFRQLNHGAADAGIDELMKKYDQDFQKLRTGVQQGR